MQRHTFRGTFQNELAALPPTGEVIELQGVSMFRVAGGRIVEHWGFADDAGFWHQCGVEVPEIMLAFAHRSQHPGGDAAG